MLCIEKLKLSIGNNCLIPSISATIFPGSITYITGKNGIGKTTLLRKLSGLSQISEGKVSLYNLKLSDYIKPYCLYIGHNLGLEGEMKVIDQLEFWAESYNSPQMIPSAVQFWDLDDFLDVPINQLSAGNAKKVALSKLTCCHADIWLLDEVETNLDANNLKFLHYAMSSKANSGGIIFITSHNPSKIEGSQTINLEDFLQ